MIRVFLVEDHPVMRETLADYLSLTDDLEVCGTADNAEDAVAGIAQADPAVLILDVALPGRSGLELLAEVTADGDLPCVVLSGHGERTYVQRAFAAGASGYVLKGNPAEVPVAVRRAAAGKSYVAPSLHQAMD